MNYKAEVFLKNIKLMLADENDHLQPGGMAVRLRSSLQLFCSEHQPQTDCLTEIRCSNPTHHSMCRYWHSKSDSHFNFQEKGKRCNLLCLTSTPGTQKKEI